MGYIRHIYTVLTTDAYRHWFAQLRDRVAQLRITARLKRIEHGNLGDAKSLGGGLSELRVDHGPGYRLYFSRRGVEVIVLLCGGDKSTQDRDIDIARVLLQQITQQASED